MKCLHGTKDLDPDHFAPCKQHITDLVYGRCLILRRSVTVSLRTPRSIPAAY